MRYTKSRKCTVSSKNWLSHLTSWQTPAILVLCFFSSVFGYKDGLYSTEEDFVVPLNQERFQEMVVKSTADKIWVVEFYNSWCGHCIHFAPTYKQLAKDLKDWKDIIVVSGIDCSQSVNMKVCRDYDIAAFPTIKMFPPMDTPERLEKLVVMDSRKVEDMKISILNFVTNFTPSSWPRLKPIVDINEIWQMKNGKESHPFIIFEKEKSELGRKVVLDLRNVSGIQVYSMLEKDAKQLGVTEYPSLYKVNSDSTYTKMAVGKNIPRPDQISFVQKILDEFKSQQGTMMKFVPESGHQSEHKEVKAGDTAEKPGLQLNKQTSNRTAVNMQDLESALHYSFRQEIAICNTIDGDKFEALKNWISVIKKYFPGRAPVQKFVVKVWDSLSSFKNQSITGEQWFNMLDKIQAKDQYLPDVIKWAACKGSAPPYRGFPCGMWTLFHTLTVGAYEQNKGSRQSNPTEILFTIRGYMKYFFGCDECAKHFLQMSEGVASEINNHAASIMWLWQGHNKVNARLHGDRSEDPSHPKVQFPSASVCSQCQVASTGGWNKNKVLEFLIKFYGSENIYVPSDLFTFGSEVNSNSSGTWGVKGSNQIPPGGKELDWWEQKQRGHDLKQIQALRDRKRKKEADAAALQALQEKEGKLEVKEVIVERSVKLGDKMMLIWGVNQFDVSICVVFYIVSALIIILLYHHFIVRKRINPCKQIKSGSFSL